MEGKSLADVINSLFKDKEVEKRRKWIKILSYEEFELVEDLKQGSEDSWQNLNEKFGLPSAIRDKLRAEITAGSKDKIQRGKKLDQVKAQILFPLILI